VVKYRVVVEGRTFEIEVGPGGQVWVDRQPFNVDLGGMDGLPGYSLLVNNRSYEAHVETAGDGECRVVVAGRPYQASLQTERQVRTKTAHRQQRSKLAEVSAPLPGLLVEVRVTEGQRVKEGDVVAVMESMKMHLELRALRSGVVNALNATAGREVIQGEVLAIIEKAPRVEPTPDVQSRTADQAVRLEVE
jgi:biotin carboxyl carrier protein